MKFHQCFFKILRKQNCVCGRVYCFHVVRPNERTKQNVTDILSFVRSFRQMDIVKTVYPPTNTVCGGIIKQSSDLKLHKLTHNNAAKILRKCWGENKAGKKTASSVMVKIKEMVFGQAASRSSRVNAVI